MKSPRTIYALWMLSIIALPVSAQENTPAVSSPIVSHETPAEPELGIEELLQRALQNNPQLPMARNNQEAARQRLKALRAKPNPTLLMIPGAGNREARDEEVLLSQPLDLFGRRRALAKVAAAELRRSVAENTGSERTLIVSVKNVAFELYAAQETESLVTVQAEIAGLFRAAAARRAELGDVPAIQVQRAELEVLRTANDLSKARAARLASRAVLNQLIGAAPQSPLRVSLPQFLAVSQQLKSRLAGSGQAEAAPPAIEPAAPAIDVASWREQLLTRALNERSDILAAEASVQARHAQADAVRRERLPNIELQARRSSFFGREGSVAFRAAISLPLFDFGSLKGERRAAEAEARAGEAALAQLRSQAASQIEQALLKLEQNRHSVENYRTGILPISIDLLRKTQIGYTQGASSYLEVLDAQRTLRQVQDEYLQALIAGQTGETALESALGAPLVAPQKKDRP